MKRNRFLGNIGNKNYIFRPTVNSSIGSYAFFGLSTLLILTHPFFDSLPRLINLVCLYSHSPANALSIYLLME